MQLNVLALAALVFSVSSLAAPIPERRSVGGIDDSVELFRRIEKDQISLAPGHDFGNNPKPEVVDHSKNCVKAHCDTNFPEANWAKMHNQPHPSPGDPQVHVQYSAGKDDQTYLRQRPGSTPSMPTADVEQETKEIKNKKGKGTGQFVTKSKPPKQHAPA